MVTLCWAAKGGSGTTVVTAALALEFGRHSLLVDLDGELPAVLGLPDPDRPGIDDWLRSATRTPISLDELVVDADATTSLLPLRRSDGAPTRRAPIDDTRWSEFADWLRRQHDDGIEVFVDGGTTTPHEILLAVADHGVARDPTLLSVAAAGRGVRPCSRPG